MSFSWNPDYLTQRLRIGVSTSMLFCAILLNTLPFIQDFENTLFDLRVRFVSAFDHPVDDIVIIGIDDEIFLGDIQLLITVLMKETDAS